MNDSAPAISEILKMRAWKHALFTTYTLSLSYFESEILRPLARAGCSDTWLIADAEGYRSSLLERRSMRVGQEYRLVPVALPNGVFHPKCIYLGSDDGDLLLVGSGNVTFGGHGKNAEVFEALSPDQAATAFRDFAEFLEAIGTRPDIAIANPDWVDDFAQRARRAAQKGRDQAGASPVRLLHPVLRPIIDQLAEVIEPHGACTEAVVMSPYHDRDAYALRELGERLGRPRLCIAVTEEGKSPFPFEEAASWPTPASPVRPNFQDSRFVHAKWCEFATPSHKVLLTGSVNATRKALTTTDNVELGVVRLLPAAVETLGWKAVARPAFAPQGRLPSGLGASEIVYASFARNDGSELRGAIVSLSPVAGAWTARLVQADGDTVSFQADVRDDGRFTVRLPVVERFSDMPALQIVMTLGEREARGWVHNEMLLAVSGRRRLSAGALARLIRREDSDDDIEALLDYLSMQAERHLRIFERPVVKVAEEDGGSAAQIVTVSLSDLAPVSGSETEPGSPASPNTLRDVDPFDVAMLRLRRMLLGHGRGRLTQQGDAGAMLAEDEQQDGGVAPNKKPDDPTRKLGLTDFERDVAKLIDAARDKPDVLSGLLVLSLEIGMWFRLYRLEDKDLAQEFFGGWFYRACRLAKAEPEAKTSLQQHILTAAATLMCLAERAGDPEATAALLHDSLERYFRGAVDPAIALRSLLPAHAGFAEVLLGAAEDADLAAPLSAILRERTVRQQLVAALAYAERGEPVPTDWAVFQSAHGALLLTALQNPNWHKRVKRAHPGCTTCGFDYFGFGRDESHAFEHKRIARCIHCKRFTVNVTP